MTRAKTSCNDATGMALAEYAVIGSLVLLVCIVGFMGVGKNMQDWLLGLKGEFGEHVQKTQQAQAAVTQAQVVLQDQKKQEQQAMNAVAGSLKVSASNPNALCNGDFCVSAPGLTGTTISTAGSNGNTSVTHSAASIYAQLAQVLASKGADAQTIDLLTRMANQGHSLGDMQSNLATKPEYTSFKNDIDGIKSGLNSFKAMAQQLNASMASYPPDVQALLKDASNVIIGVGDSYSFTESADGHIAYQYTSRNIQLTHSSSNTICSQGGNKAQCMR